MSICITFITSRMFESKIFLSKQNAFGRIIILKPLIIFLNIETIINDNDANMWSLVKMNTKQTRCFISRKIEWFFYAKMFHAKHFTQDRKLRINCHKERHVVSVRVADATCLFIYMEIAYG